MKIIVPKPIALDSAFTTTAVNADPDYDPLETCANGVKRTYQGFIYLSLQADNTGHTPGITDSALWWSLVTASNKWAMFDPEVATQTRMPNTLTLTFDTSYVDSVACTNVDAASVTVTVTKNAAVVYSKTLDLADYSSITDWSLYYFSDHTFKTEFVFTDLPPIPDVTITMTVTKPSSDVAVGNCAIGRVFDVGLEEYNLQREGIDYSVVTTDKFGQISIDHQAYARKYSTTAVLPNSRYDYVSKKLDSLASKPVVCIGGNGIYSSLIVFGLISYTLTLTYFDKSHASIEVKGYV